MLTRLFINNYALIDRLEVNFGKGLTIITGETGAGKSILLGALGLILGKRADNSALLNKSSKCVVEGEFDISAYNLEKFFADHDLDFDEQTVIRREINPEGKSRAFVNDTPVTLQLLRELTAHLIDIHSQHESLLINDGRFQIDLLDVMADNKQNADLFSKQFFAWKEKIHKQEEKKNAAAKAVAEKDFLHFQLEELEAARLTEGELKLLEEESETLSHAQQIKESLNAAIHILSESDHNLLSMLQEADVAIKQAARFHKPAETVHQRVNSVKAELKDIVSELETLSEKTELNPERLQRVEERLDLLNRLCQKHRVKNSDELIEKKKELEEKLGNFENLEAEIEQLEKEILEEEKILKKSAEEMSSKRKAAALELEKELHRLLAATGIPDGRVKFDFEPLQEGGLNQTGMDKINLLFSANKGVAPVPVQKVASGGELSRLMLCIKALMAERTSLPAIIFDEIDTGISGNIALKVGNIIRQMSEKMQVIAITHLPQMAGKGHAHYHVYKEQKKDMVATRIQLLKGEERLREIARMLTGDLITDAGLKNARELMNS
jgi:DNA repair protein RecN (Recombination protein N)